MLLFLPYMACSHDQRRSPAPTSKYEHRLATTIPCSEFTGSQGKWEMENRLTPAMPPSSTDALSNDNQSDGTLTSDVAHNFREFEENSIQERPRNHGNLQLQGFPRNDFSSSPPTIRVIQPISLMELMEDGTIVPLDEMIKMGIHNLICI
ncbi:hypothetical protein E3N88_37772 [Mikania micrantha]|uniref:Uncharacterized protein n=1 Tax=Mikania micrantha TaxID=192012 RepID=A0A5N6LSY9_9ASTR|nr:hypothetical protein E3N88_37772 [Mikania micrantha]